MIWVPIQRSKQGRTMLMVVVWKGRLVVRPSYAVLVKERTHNPGSIPTGVGNERRVIV